MRNMYFVLSVAATVALVGTAQASPSAASSSSFGTLRTGPTPIEAPVEIDGELLYVDTDEVLNPLARYIRNA
ncbi:MAG: hypothetical protein AAFV29_20475, partial [Myxococcota bacterium]